jgi:hypothetical protein
MDDLRQASADVSGVQILSPAARAVFEAFNSKFDWIEDGVPGPQFRAIAAALRAAADQCAEGATHWELYAIAAELEATSQSA